MTRVRQALLPVAVAVAVVVTVAACSPPSGISEASGGFGSSDSGASTSGAIKIGVVANLSGPLSYIGLATEAGAQHAADVLNESGGIDGREVELVKCDTQFSTSTEVNCLTKLTSVDGVEMILLDVPNGINALGPEKTKALGVPVFLPLVCGPDLDPQEEPNVFCMGGPITDSTDLEVIADYLVNDAGKDRIAVIASDDEFFTAAATEFRQELAAQGEETVTNEKFTFGDVDMSAQVRAAQRANADTVMCLGLGADCARVAKAMDDAGFDAQLAGTSTLYMRAFRELAKEASNDAVFTLPHSKSNDVDPAFIQWLFDFLVRYGFKTFVIGGSTSPDYPGIEFPTYRAVDTYAKAVKLAGTTDTQAVIQALERPEGFESIGITSTWSPATRFATVDPETEPWVTRFTNGHISWDLDKRSVPALEETRIAWEERIFGSGKNFDTDVDFIIEAATVFREELEKRKDALVTAEGQAEYDARIAQLDQALQIAEEIRSGGDSREMPEL